MADASSVSFYPSLGRILPTHGHAVLVTPKPDDGTFDERRQLLGSFRIFTVERRTVLMMSEENDAPLVTLKIYRVLQPVEFLIPQIATGRKEVLDNGHTDGVIASV